MESAEVVKAQAASWLVKRDSGDWSEEDQAQFTHWLEASTAHVVAFIRLEAAWKRAGRLKPLGAGLPRGIVPPRRRWQFSPVFLDRPGTSGTRSPSRRQITRYALVAGHGVPTTMPR